MAPPYPQRTVFTPAIKAGVFNANIVDPNGISAAPSAQGQVLIGNEWKCTKIINGKQCPGKVRNKKKAIERHIRDSHPHGTKVMGKYKRWRCGCGYQAKSQKGLLHHLESTHKIEKQSAIMFGLQGTKTDMKVENYIPALQQYQAKQQIKDKYLGKCLIIGKKPESLGSQGPGANLIASPYPSPSPDPTYAEDLVSNKREALSKLQKEFVEWKKLKIKTVDEQLSIMQQQMDLVDEIKSLIKQNMDAEGGCDEDDDCLFLK